MPEETLVRFTDHPRKKVFRALWAKPLLKFVKEHLNQKLVYLGLPGIAAYDIKAWIEYLRIVIAFQCLDESKEYEEAEKEFSVLQAYLNECATSGKLEDYGLYQGFLEQVVMTGLDDNNAGFNQSNAVTVYNLDFCNKLTSPYDVVYPNGGTKKCTKLDVVDRLLDIQNKLPAALSTDKFLMYITVNANFLESDFDSIKDPEYKSYKKHIKDLKQTAHSARLIKAYAFYHLNLIFKKHNFQAEFMPTMYYTGSGSYRVTGTGQLVNTWMLTFTILGSRIIDEQAPLYQQSLTDYLNCKFLFANDSKISCYQENKFVETDFTADPLTLINESYTVQNLWT